MASLAEVRDRVGYEGQAAVELEGLAAATRPDGVYPFDLAASPDTLVVDTRPLVRAVAADVGAGVRASSPGGSTRPWSR